MEVGRIKRTVAVAVGISVGVPVGRKVIVGARVGGNKAAVCVCAAAAVPAIMVVIGRGSEFDGAGAERTGISHASKKSNAANKRNGFLTDCLSMIVAKGLVDSNTKFYKAEIFFPNPERPPG